MSGTPDGAGGTGGTGNDGGVGAGGGNVEQPWYAGQDAETIGYLTNRGLDKSDAKAAALASIKAHREAEKHLGAPANELIRLPKDGNDPAWRSIWNKLGVPADEKGYDFKDLKFADGTPVKEEFQGFLAKTFHTNSIPAEKAATVARELVSYLDKLGEGGDADSAARVAVEQAELKTQWGAQYAPNMIVAQNAARALGVDEETISTLADMKGVGYSKVMELFRNIGEKIGEDRFIRGNGGRQGPMTIPAAKEELATLKADKAWVDKFNKGDVAAKKQFNDLTAIIASEFTDYGN